jgi:glycosyltransferase involved in cell wall biosynthesis
MSEAEALVVNPTPKKKTLCLNMIVKNEGHIIAQNLEKLTSKFNFDYWVISDTGSTDNTIELITTFFKNKGIPGELHQDEWKGFGHNRTVALAHAFGKTDYLLIFDADDEILGELKLPLDTMDLDSYRLVFGNANTYSYERPLIVNNHKKWRFVGVLHEYLDTLAEGESHTTATIVGDYSVLSGRTGNRSADPDKYYKDALVLEKAYAEEVQANGALVERYCFYCANSYFDCGQFENAAIWYKKVLDHKGWDQEKYISCFKLYKCYKRLKMTENSMFYLIKSFYYDKERVECIFKLIVHYTCESQPQIAYSYYSLIQKHYETVYVLNEHSSKLFVDNRIANFFLPYYIVIVADGIKNPNLGIKMFEIIFMKKTEHVSAWHLGNLLHNLQLFIGKVAETEKVAPGYNAHFFKLCNSYFEFMDFFRLLKFIFR